MIANNITPFYATHPGEVIKEEVVYRKISQKQLAEEMGMSYKILNDILNERRKITAETAMLFEAALGISAQTLLKLQMEYNIHQAKKDESFLQRLAGIRRIAVVL